MDIYGMLTAVAQARTGSNAALDAAEACHKDAKALIAKARRALDDAMKAWIAFRYTGDAADRASQARLADDALLQMRDIGNVIDLAERRRRRCRSVVKAMKAAREAADLYPSKLKKAYDAARRARAKAWEVDAIDATHLPKPRQEDLRKANATARFFDDLNGALKGRHFHFTPCGTFEGSKAGLKPKDSLVGRAEATKNRIEFEFRPSPDCECKRMCFVSVQHFIDVKTGKVAFVPEDVRWGGYNDIDDHSIMGHMIDTVAYGPCPCLPKDGQGPKGLPKLGGGTGMVAGQAGHDEPNNATDTHAQVFETAAFCLPSGDQRARILQSMRWKVVMKLPERELVSEIIPNGTSIDWGRPSVEFEAAVAYWIGRTGGDFSKC